MSTQITRNRVYNLANIYGHKAVSVGYCGAHYLTRRLDRIGYGCGVYGWNYDAFHLFGKDGRGVILCTGYRSIPGETADRAARIADRFAKSLLTTRPGDKQAEALRAAGLEALQALFVEAVTK